MRFAAVLVCLCMFTTYLASYVFAKYSSTASGTDTAKTATIGSLQISSLSSIDITPGVDIKRDITLSRTAALTDTAAWIILAVNRGGWEYNSELNRFYISNKFDNPHEVKPADYPIYFDIDTSKYGSDDGTHSWKRVGAIDGISGYVFYAQRIDAGTAGALPNSVNRTNIIKNNTVYVSAEINTDDIDYIRNKANTVSFSVYVVSSYGFSSDSSLTELCKKVYNNSIK